MGIPKNYFLVFFLLVWAFSFSQHKKAYTIYSGEGVESGFHEMLAAALDKDIVLFGEQHNSAIAHWLELELALEAQKNRKITLGLEMFEADEQGVLDAYLNKEIDQKGLDSLAKLWPNYSTDYAPLVNFAKENGVKVMATNIPRRYANKVYKQGFSALDSLSDKELDFVAPLPILFDPGLPQYQKILTMMGDHGSPELVKAQAIKDATMAHFILSNKKEDYLFIHYNGSYHSDFYEGILWYLKNQAPEIRYLTISTVTQKDLSTLEEEHKNRADFIIVVDENMTTTY